MCGCGWVGEWVCGVGERAVERLNDFFLQFCPGGELFDYIVAREKLKVCTSVDISTGIADCSLLGDVGCTYIFTIIGLIHESMVSSQCTCDCSYVMQFGLVRTKTPLVFCSCV